MRLLSHPILCNYYLTYRCNATCPFCDIWEKPSQYATLENATHNLRDLKKLGVKVIDFTGGEPLLNRALPEFLKLAKGLGFITTVTTNGLLYPKHSDEINGLVNMLHFSLDSHDKDFHDHLRGVPCFSAVMTSLDIAQHLGEKPDILFTVTSENIFHIENVYENITKPRKLMLLLNPIFSYPGLEIKNQLNTEHLKILSEWGQKKGVYLNEAFVQLRKDGGNHISNPVCKAASSCVVISPDNMLLLPCYHLGKEKYPIQNNLYNLWHSTEIHRQIKLEGRYQECEGCTINCYFQPSFAVEMNSYFWKALPSTLKYGKKMLVEKLG
ncbi:MAG: radical SAM protein [Bacteroidetes bacterium RIFCSPLOWO2_02_FULL_36_8]|nr:MAG: radical SAM protein [Bacteroidetes bacterium RIFCSPLOWO2_02_FULL_36_8]OFY70394.1 MAG: radical SAM protein [Bacteroidetes bacterium RIFCSPLOWO2_12_FULL_37_12]